MSSESPDNAYPSSRADRIFWVQQRAEDVEINAVDIGVPPAQATAFGASGTKANASNRAYEASRSRTKTLGLVARQDAAAMDVLSSGVIANVRAKANASADPAAVYNLAEVAPRQAASPQGPPSTPAVVTPTLNADGSLTVRWGGTGAGNSYEVQRQLTPVGEAPAAWSLLPGPFRRSAADPGVPAGTAAVAYRVRAIRSAQASPWSNPGVLQLVAEATTPSGLRLTGSQSGSPGDLSAAA